MAFLTIKTKRVLESIEMLPSSMYTVDELIHISKLPEFYAWSSDGYYANKYIPYTVDIATETTFNTPNRSIEDFKTEGEYKAMYIIPISERTLG